VGASTSSSGSDPAILRLGDDIVRMANDYISGRIPLHDINVWIHDHMEQGLALDKTAHPGAGLIGFIQVRIYDMDHGLDEATLRREVQDFMSSEGLLKETPKARAG
jgi:hypothetical protein